MVPMKHSTIFKSRWMALIWAAGIIYFALQVAAPDTVSDGNGNNTQVTDVTGAPVSDQDVKTLESAINGM